MSGEAQRSPPPSGTAGPDSAPAPAAPRIRRLMLADFRSYGLLDLVLTARLVAFVGENGAGKTNILEALSLLSPGRGLRRADLADMARIGGSGGFAVSATLGSGGDDTRLGFGAEPSEGGLLRRARIEGETVSSATAFADHMRLVWLTPAMDGLFAGPAGDRRRFLDRLVLAVDPGHGSRASALEKALRSRNRLLEAERPDAAWLDAVEREVAETGTAVAAARLDTVQRLSAIIRTHADDTSPFPWADLRLEGTLEAELAHRPALDVEDLFRTWLREGRSRDRAAGRALSGPQASDLVVRHGPKQVDAALSSTGEQKALLVGLVLAHARLVARSSGLAPVVLLDEVAAHLDPRRRAALFETLDGLGGQVFMTGADPGAFRELPATSERFEVTPGRARAIVSA